MQDFTQKPAQNDCAVILSLILAWKKSTCRTGRNLLLLLRLAVLGFIDILAVMYQSVRTGISISIAEKWHIRMRRRFGECTRARREPAGQSQYMEKKRKREENDQKQTGA